MPASTAWRQPTATITKEARCPHLALRTGFTTGSCAAAAAKAATLLLLGRAPLEEVDIPLPTGRRVTFRLHRAEMEGGAATCGVIKDGGDDPDVTHGAEIRATVSWVEEPGIHLEGGVGVGRVTKPGLGIPVGGPAINPVPRRMIAAAVEEGLASAGPASAGPACRGLQVVISVPDGEERAKKTLNARLGIVGGVSILGTTGLVIPYSTAAYRASIVQALAVALAQGCDHVVLTTGGRSEAYAQRLLPRLPEEAFIQMGEFLGFSLGQVAARGIRRVTIAGMVGKLSKVAAGHFHLHARASEVDLDFLAGVAGVCGAPPEVVEEIRGANTARHVAEIVEAHGIPVVFERIASLVVERSMEQCRGRIPEIECILTDFEGRLLARAEAR